MLPGNALQLNITQRCPFSFYTHQTCDPGSLYMVLKLPSRIHPQKGQCTSFRSVSYSCLFIWIHAIGFSKSHNRILSSQHVTITYFLTVHSSCRSSSVVDQVAAAILTQENLICCSRQPLCLLHDKKSAPYSFTRQNSMKFQQPARV